MQPMNRRDFLAVSAMLGLGVAAGCSDDGGEDETSPNTSASTTTEPVPVDPDPEAERFPVLIVGAGAAGMAAAHLLGQRGIEYRILEAAPTYGGRVKRSLDFVDFPIPLGGEWLHAAESTLTDIVNDQDTEVDQPMQAYDPDDRAILVTAEGDVVEGALGDYTDLKFIGSSWLDFFDDYIVPGIANRMVFDTQIVDIDHSGGEVALTTPTGDVWTADQVIVSVPMKVLQDGDVSFTPPLPGDHQDALDSANIWTGMKVFIEFEDAFYPTFLEVAADAGDDGQRAYYDAGYGQNGANVLGLFTVGELSKPYQAVDPGDELRDLVLAELDEIFDGAASANYVQHISQNWANEPFIKAAYLADTAPSWISEALAESIDDRVFFAGCSYTSFDDWSSVHTAVRSARDAADAITG
ncbi:MAG: FAD-dependent oxidoreductase [Actinomycetota bacterium]